MSLFSKTQILFSILALGAGSQAQAGETLRMTLIPEASLELAKVLAASQGKIAEIRVDGSKSGDEASCDIEASFASDGEEERAEAGNQIRCEVRKKGKNRGTVGLDLGKVALESRTNHQGPQFALKPPLAAQLFAAFEKTHRKKFYTIFGNLRKEVSAPDILTRQTVCDHQGNQCSVAYYLAKENHADSVASVYCFQQTELTESAREKAEVIPYTETYDHTREERLKKLVDRQLAKKERMIYGSLCMVQDL